MDQVLNLTALVEVDIQEQQTRLQQDSWIPVSYTHLDVYKRQLLQFGTQLNPKSQQSLMQFLQLSVQMCIRDRLSAEEKQNYFIKFNVDWLLRGDYQSRMNGYALSLIHI